MSTPGLNPLTYNQWVLQVATLAVAQVQSTSAVYQFIDTSLNAITPQILSYAEGRIQRDLDLLASQTSNLYALTAGSNILSLPIDDFLIVQTVEWIQTNGSQIINSFPLLAVSKEFIQNVYGGLVSAAPPQYFAMYGDNFGDGADTYNNILLGPAPNYAYQIRITGTIRTPSLYSYATDGPANSTYTYISAYYPDMLLMASMIFVSAYQRNFSSTSDDPQMGQTYEKQYQALRLSAIAEEQRKKLMGSGWTPYSTPTAATSSR
jgi:hypothetical protein